MLIFLKQEANAIAKIGEVKQFIVKINFKIFLAYEKENTDR